MSAPSLNPELVTALKRLRLGGLLPTLAERLSLCEKQSLPYQDLLLMLLCDEISRRDSGASERRAQQAGLSPDMVLSRWDASVNATPKTTNNRCSCKSISTDPAARKRSSASRPKHTSSSLSSSSTATTAQSVPSR